MPPTDGNADKFIRRFERERKARKSAEAIIEEKTREVYYANLARQEAHEILQEKSEELSAVNNQLTQLIKHKEVLQNELKDALQEALVLSQLKSEFLTNISHELRTPLNGIMGMAYLLHDTEIDIEQQEYLTQINSSSEALLSIVEDILDFSKLESNHINVLSEPFSIHTLLNNLHGYFLKKATDNGLILKFDKDPNLPQEIVGDMKLIKRALLSLLDNAINFTAAGQISLSALVKDQTNTHVTLQFTVCDTGVGIPADKIDHIFDSFSQVDSSLTRKVGGMGLGLTISKDMVEAMGGTITVESEVGIGSIFYVTIPFERPPNAILTDQPSHNEQLQVLLVEDNLINQKVAAKLFERIGCQLSIAKDGEEALQIIKDNYIDVAFVDLHMPNLDGYAFTKQLTSNSNSDRPRLIAMLANCELMEEENLITHQFDDSITKPLKLKTVLELLQKESAFS